MAQHDYTIANQGFPATRADINNALLAISSNNSGTSAPSTQYAGQFWLDTNTPSSTTWSLYIHDGSDDILFAQIDTSANTVNFLDSALADDVVINTSGAITTTGAFRSIGIDDNANALAMTITDEEKIGVGETAPLGKLHVKSGDSGVSSPDITDLVVECSGNGGMSLLGATNGQVEIAFGDSGDANIGRFAYNHDSNFLATVVNASEVMRIDSSGNVGIGVSSILTPSGSRKAVIISNGTNGSAIHFNNLGGEADNPRIFSKLSNTTDLSMAAGGSSGVLTFHTGGGTERMRITSSGHITAPNLNTTGSTSNRYPLYWVHTGTTGSIEPYTGSIRAMKTDINDMGSVNWIHSLTPRSFKFRDYETDEDGNKVYLETTNNLPNTEYGLIAEEVNEVSGSDYILDKQTDEDGNEKLKGVLYHNLVPVLLKAVQEQKNIIQELEARITTLEANNP